MACCVAGFFLYCAWPGLLIGFDNDDVMNLQFAWHPSLSSLVIGNLVPFTPFYRPAGAAYYRICFAIFGWRPAAFRAVTFALMFANLGLVYRLARRLTKSAEIAVFAALIFSFHPKLRQIYMSNGAVYDVLCGTFSLLALLYYIRLRDSERSWKWWESAAIVALFIAAINAKEMAAILPLLFLTYEWIYYPPAAKNVRAISNWIWKHGRITAFTLLLSCLAFWGKRQPGGAFFQKPLYEPSFTIHRLFSHEKSLVSDLFQLPNPGLSSAGMVVVYAALFLIAALSRKKYLWFCAWFALLAPLPVTFIVYRGFFVMYLPMAGWAIFTAAVLVDGRDWLWKVIWKRPPVPAGAFQPERVFLFAAIAYLLAAGRNADYFTMMKPDPSVNTVADTHSDILRLNERLPDNARVLLLHSRYPDISWGPMEIMGLLYRDRGLIVDRPTMMGAPPDTSTYDRVMEFDGRDLKVVRKKSGAQRGTLPR